MRKSKIRLFLKHIGGDFSAMVMYSGSDSVNRLQTVKSTASVTAHKMLKPLQPFTATPEDLHINLYS